MNYQGVGVVLVRKDESKALFFHEFKDGQGIDVLWHSLPSKEILHTARNLLVRCKHSNGDALYFAIKERDTESLFDIGRYSMVIERKLTYEEAVNIDMKGNNTIIDVTCLRELGATMITDIIGSMYNKGVLE
jgi:hypothetical protein